MVAPLNERIHTSTEYKWRASCLDPDDVCCLLIVHPGSQYSDREPTLMQRSTPRGLLTRGTRRKQRLVFDIER